MVVTISMASGMEATIKTTVKLNASTTEVMCARCRYTTEHSVSDMTTSTIIISISMFCSRYECLEGGRCQYGGYML